MKNILLIGNLSNSKFKSKTSPLLSIDSINNIYLFRSNGNLYFDKNKVFSLRFPLASFFDFGSLQWEDGMST